MTITVASTAGFCFGVDRAVKLIYELEKEGKSVCTLGEIIHNPDVVKDLESKGVRVIDSLSEAKKGETVVIRSHGVPKNVYDEATCLGLDLRDATCPFVLKIHNIVSGADPDALVLIAGDRYHPEVMGIFGHAKCRAEAFDSEEELDNIIELIQKETFSQVIMVAQTTFNKILWEKSSKKIKNIYTNAKIYDTICSATRNRQNEAMSLAEKSDTMIVIGGKHSSNTNKLYDICREKCRTVYIERAEELKNYSFGDAKYIGVTAGASTPSYIIKEVHKTMSEELKRTIEEEDVDFEKAIDDDGFFKKIYGGMRVTGIVVGVNQSEIQVDLGTKHAGFVSASEYSNDPNVKLTEKVKVGDELELEVIKVNDQEGIAFLSKKRVDATQGFDELEAAKDSGEVCEGVVVEVVKGGIIVVSHETRVFIPASQATLSKNDSLDDMLKTTVRFKVLESKDKRGRKRILGSVREVLYGERKEKKEKFWNEVKVGDVFTGAVKSITSYGAFVDLGGVDGMVHISELSWKRIKNPTEVVNVGDVITVYVREIDAEKKRISLGYKKSEDNPWLLFTSKYAVGDVIDATIVSLPQFGAFARIIDGVDGLIHISQISNKKIGKPSDELKVGENVKVKITEIDEERKRVSLSIRALLTDEEAVEEPASTEE